MKNIPFIMYIAFAAVMWGGAVIVSGGYDTPAATRTTGAVGTYQIGTDEIIDTRTGEIVLMAENRSGRRVWRRPGTLPTYPQYPPCNPPAPKEPDDAAH